MADLYEALAQSRLRFAVSRVPLSSDLRLCWPCSHFGFDFEEHEAEYWWRLQQGTWLGLCAKCCSIWRQEATEYPSLLPAKVTAQRPEPGLPT